MNKSIQYLIGGAAIVIIIAGLKAGSDLVNQILMSLLLANCITPLPAWLTRKGLSKGISLAVSLLVILAGGFLITVLLTNSVADMARSVPAYEQKLTELYNEFLAYAKSHNLNISELIQKVNIGPSKIFTFATRVGVGMLNMLSSSLIILMIIVFYVIEMEGYKMDIRKGRREKISLHDWLVSMGGDLRKYITITALKGVITAVLNFILLLILGVEFAFLWAFFSFFMNFIPNLGFALSFLPPALVALITKGPLQALIVLIGFWFFNFIVENVIGPVFMKKSLDVSLLNSFLSLLIWGWILGLPGAILGIPLTMVVMKIFNVSRKASRSEHFSPDALTSEKD